MRKRRFVLSVLLLLALLAAGAAAFGEEAAFTEEEKAYIALGEKIYVAGNPDLFPYEYYDEERGRFVGVLPEFLQELEAFSGLQFSYVNPGAEDNRFYLAENKQVEMISIEEGEAEAAVEGGAGDGEAGGAMERENRVYCFTAGTGTEARKIGFAFTEIADPRLCSVIRKALLALDQETRDGILLSAAGGGQSEDDRILWAFVGLAAATAAALAAFFLLRRERRRSMEYRYFDGVTGLWNVDYLRKNYESLITDENRPLYCVIYISARLSRLRSVYSEEEVNCVLRHIADVLTELCEDRDMPARIGAEDFVVVKKCSGREAAVEWVRTLTERICAYTDQKKKDYFLDPRFGVYRLKPLDVKLETPLANARRMAGYAVERDLSCVVCSEKILRDFEESLALESDVVKALEKGEFRVYIQPYVSLRNGEICGGEALARWEHPFRGLIKPSRFIPLLEECNLISQVDIHIWELACDWIQKQREKGRAPVPVSCNFSRINLRMTDFVGNVIEIVEKYGISFRDIHMEITESAVLEGRRKERKRVMELLQEKEAAIYLDDFGSGYTSFQDLKDYPLDTIKIDKTILDGADGDEGEAILESLIALGHRLGARVLCEGVETREQADLLVRLGCDVAQGYFYYQPMPLSEFEKLIFDS